MATAYRTGRKRGAAHRREREHRSLANMIEVMIRDYCKRKGVPIPRAAGAVR